MDWLEELMWSKKECSIKDCKACIGRAKDLADAIREEIRKKIPDTNAISKKKVNTDFLNGHAYAVLQMKLCLGIKI